MNITGKLFHNMKISFGTQSVFQTKKTDNQGKDQKLERILSKFRSGKKLTNSELAYLQEKAPTIYAKVVRITMERDALENKMKNAKTKDEMTNLMVGAMNGVDELSMGDEFESTSRINQYKDIYQKYFNKVTNTNDEKSKIDEDDNTTNLYEQNGKEKAKKKGTLNITA